MFTLLAAVALAGASPGATALAHDSYVEVEGRVSLAGLDLSNSADVAELNERIALKALNICRRGVPRELWDSRTVRKCTESVVSSGAEQIAALVPATRQLAQAETN